MTGDLDTLLARMPKPAPADQLITRTLERIDDDRHGRVSVHTPAPLTVLVEQWMRELVREQRRMAHAVFGYAAAAVACMLLLGIMVNRQGEPRPLTISRPATNLSSADVGAAEAQVTALHRYLERGVLPPAEAVSTSAIVAYFSPVRATEGAPVALRASSAPMPGAEHKRLVRVTAVGATRPFNEHMPVTMVALVDVADAKHLVLARETLRALTRNFDSDDQLAIVIGGHTPRIVRSIDEVESTVANSGEGALDLAYAAVDNMTAEAKHLIVLTDGACDGLDNAATYMSTARFSMLRLGKWAPQRCQATDLARETRGVYAQADNIDEAVQLFANPLRRSLLPVVRDPQLRLTAHHAVRALGATAQDGELGAGEAMTAFFEVDADDADIVATVDFRGASVSTVVGSNAQDATHLTAAAASIGWALAAQNGESANAHLEAAEELLAMADIPHDARYKELGALLNEIRGALRTTTRVR